MKPVRSLASTVQRILSYPGTSINSSICNQMIEGKLLEFTQDAVVSSFLINAASIGKEKLGFKPDEIGTLSNRCAASMAMFMDDTPVYIIIRDGVYPKISSNTPYAKYSNSARGYQST